MALGSCYTCVKYLMFAFNFIFWLLGCAILGVGIWLRVDENAVEFMHQQSQMKIFYTLAYAMIAVGLIIMIIGFLGCCGAIRESQCLLATFFLFLFIIFATLLGFGIWAVVAKDSFHDVVKDVLEEGTKEYGTNLESTQLMDSVQTYFKCCGWKLGTLDYIAVTKLAPESCSGHLTTSCTDQFYSWVESRLIIVAGVAIGIAVVMIMGMIFSMVLCCAIRDTGA